MAEQGANPPDKIRAFQKRLVKTDKQFLDFWKLPISRLQTMPSKKKRKYLGSLNHNGELILMLLFDRL